MSVRVLKFIAAGMLAAATTASAASAVTVSETQVMFQNGQDFTYNFANINHQPGSSATLTIANGQSLTNPGPYDGLDIDSQGTSNEFFEVIVEGTSIGTFNCSGNSGHTLIAGCVGSVDSVFSLPLSISPTLLANALTDGTFSVVIAFSTAVTAFNDQDEVIASLNYVPAAVALPATSLLFSTGLLGLGLLGRQKVKPNFRKSKIQHNS